MQLADLFIGAIGYRNRKVYDEENSSWTQKELMMHIIDKSEYSLTKKNKVIREKI